MSLGRHRRDHLKLGITSFGPNTVTVGERGMFSTVAEAVAFVNTTPRYTVIYSTGTVTLTTDSQSITPSGGASFLDAAITATAARKELYLYLDSANLFLPIIGVAPPLASGAPATSWGNYGELKYKYIGTTGAKSYELVTPNWYHIVLLPGEVWDGTLITWPKFCTLSGTDAQSCVFRGAIQTDVGDPGIWMKDFKWGGINGVVAGGEESLIVIDDAGVSEDGYSELIMNNVIGGAGNAERDVVFRTSGTKSHALFKSVNCEYFAHYDVIQCVSRNIIFKANDIHIRTQDTTVMEPTGFKWFSGATAPATDLLCDMTNNNFFVEASAGARNCVGAILIADNAAYWSLGGNAPPTVYGRVVGNHFKTHHLGTGIATAILTPNSLWDVATNGRLLIDNNTFDTVASGGTRKELHTAATQSFSVWGKNNVTQDGSAAVITGAPFRHENHGLSAAIATGATIAHGLRVAPTTISVIPTGAKTDVYATVDATNITVNYGGGGTSTFHWKAEI